MNGPTSVRHISAVPRPLLSRAHNRIMSRCRFIRFAAHRHRCSPHAHTHTSEPNGRSRVVADTEDVENTKIYAKDKVRRNENEWRTEASVQRRHCRGIVCGVFVCVYARRHIGPNEERSFIVWRKTQEKNKHFHFYCFPFGAGVRGVYVCARAVSLHSPCSTFEIFSGFSFYFSCVRHSPARATTKAIREHEQSIKYIRQ